MNFGQLIDNLTKKVSCSFTENQNGIDNTALTVIGESVRVATLRDISRSLKFTIEGGDVTAHSKKAGTIGPAIGRLPANDVCFLINEPTVAASALLLREIVDDQWDEGPAFVLTIVDNADTVPHISREWAIFRLHGQPARVSAVSSETRDMFLKYDQNKLTKGLFAYADKKLISDAALTVQKILMYIAQCTTTRHKMPNKVRRKFSKTYPKGVYEYHTLTLKPDAEVAYSEPQGGHHASPRQHTRRGHYRHLATGKTVFVRDCLVGKRSLGIVDKEYRVGEAE